MAQCLIKEKEHFVLPSLVLNLGRQEVVSLSQFRRSPSKALIELSLKLQTISNCQLQTNEEDDSTIVLFNSAQGTRRIHHIKHVSYFNLVGRRSRLRVYWTVPRLLLFRSEQKVSIWRQELLKSRIQQANNRSEDRLVCQLSLMPPTRGPIRYKAYQPSSSRTQILIITG